VLRILISNLVFSLSCVLRPPLAPLNAAIGSPPKEDLTGDLPIFCFSDLLTFSPFPSSVFRPLISDL
jgi:hypothetical protein